MSNYLKFILFLLSAALFFFVMFYDDKSFSINTLLNYDNGLKLFLFIGISIMVGFMLIRGLSFKNDDKSD